MGQIDVYEYLKRERESGNDEYHSISSVYRALIDMKRADTPTRKNVWKSIKRLEKAGYLEVKGVGVWPSYFRLKMTSRDKR